MKTEKKTRRPRRFPIVDLQFHNARLRELERDSWDRSERETRALTTWHTTAVALLKYGHFHQLDGPGWEASEGGRITPREVDDFLTMTVDQDGNPSFQTSFKVA